MTRCCWPSWSASRRDRQPSVRVAASRGEVFTTGSLYWRLARALARPGAGALSQRLASMTENERRRAESAMAALPVEIGMLGLRQLVPVIRALPGQPKLLTAEAVAAGMVLGGEIVVTTESLLLAQVAAAAGISVDVVSLA